MLTNSGGQKDLSAYSPAIVVAPTVFRRWSKQDPFSVESSKKKMGTNVSILSVFPLAGLLGGDSAGGHLIQWDPGSPVDSSWLSTSLPWLNL